MMEALTKVILYKEYDIDTSLQMFLKSQNVKTEFAILQESNSEKLHIVEQDKLLIIVCCCDISGDTFPVIDKMKENFFFGTTKALETDQRVMEYCELYERGLIDDIQVEFGVKIKPTNSKQKYGWKIHGPTGTIELACQSLKKVINNISSQISMGNTAAKFLANESGKKLLYN